MAEQTKTAYDLSGDAAKVLLDVLLAALPVALIYSLVLLVVSGVLIAVMHRRRLYSRERKLWNVLTKLHYPLWMFIFACFGFAFGMIASMQSTADRAIDEKIQPALAGMVPPIQQKIIESLPPELADKPMTGQAIYDHVIENSIDEEAMNKALDEAEGWVERSGIEIQYALRRYLTKVAIDSAIKRAGEKLGMAGEDVEFTLETFKAIDFSEEADTIAGKVTNAAKMQVGAFANGARMQIFIWCGILLLLLFVEPLVYYKLVLPRKKKALEAAAAGELPE